MFRKYVALFLAVMLFAAAAVPTAMAAENEPLVLFKEETGMKNVQYYYHADGSLARTVELGTGTGNYTEYGYIRSRMIQEDEYINGKLSVMTVYDFYGTEYEKFCYDEAGNVTSYRISEPVYDGFGRLTNLRQWYPEDASGVIQDFRYEYNSEPTVFLGSYEQDGDLDNGSEPIEWLVMAAEGENVLLISKYGLDTHPYHSISKSVSWEDSSLRDWLNEDFFAAAFPEYQPAYVNPYTVHFELFETPENISDRVFLLSAEEVKQYFPKEEDRICVATPYAAEQMADTRKDTGAGWWMLRTPGKTKLYITDVGADGRIDAAGKRVSDKQGLVRPALWVSKTILSDAEEAPLRKHENVTYQDSKTGETQHLVSILYTYDNAGHLKCKQDYLTGDMEKWEYDEHGNQTLYTYMNSDASYYAEVTYTNRYSDEGLLLEQESVAVITEKILGKTTETTETTLTVYVYNAEGNCTFILRSGSEFSTYSETRTYDDQGNLLTVFAAGAFEEQYTYVPLSQALLK